MMTMGRQLAERGTTAEIAVQVVTPGSQVYIGGNCAEPESLVAALVRRAPGLSGVTIHHLLSMGDTSYVGKDYAGIFRHNAFFIGSSVRDAVNEGRADFTPVFLHEIPGLFQAGRIPLDVAMVQVSPPDANGYCSLGISVDVTKAAVDSARFVIAEVNPRMPRTHGDSMVHLSRFTHMVAVDRPLTEYPASEPGAASRRIGEQVAALVEDGSTLQIGIGEVPDACLLAMDDKRDLGIHTEMLSDSAMRLIEKGVVNNSRKAINKGQSVTSFIMGSRRLYEWVDDNPDVIMRTSDFVNDPYTVSRNPRVVALNSAIEIDLTGQICSDSIGDRFYSGIGGQLDFIRGSSRSQGGKPIIALPSTAKGGAVSRIVPRLRPGAGVVTSRGDAHYVITEHGTAYLHGRSVRERAAMLIRIAHPDFRDELELAARERRLIP